MKIAFLFVVLMFTSSVINCMPDCSESESFRTSIYAMLKTELLPVNIDSPEIDAKIRYDNGDYRFLGYGQFSGIKIPYIELLEKNEICEYGIKILPGMTDSFESRDHRLFVERFKVYIKKYNMAMLKNLKKQGQTEKDREEK